MNTCTNNGGSRRGKAEQIIEGCKTLQKTQRQGQCFSEVEIAKACGVHRRAIQFLMRRALYKVGTALAARHRGFLAEQFVEATPEELHGRLKDLRKHYITGNPDAVRRYAGAPREKHFDDPDPVVRRGIASLSTIAQIIRSRRLEGTFVRESDFSNCTSRRDGRELKRLAAQRHRRAEDRNDPVYLAARRERKVTPGKGHPGRGATFVSSRQADTRAIKHELLDHRQRMTKEDVHSLLGLAR